MITATEIRADYRDAEQQAMHKALTESLAKWQTMAVPSLDKEVSELTPDERFAILVQAGEEVEPYGIELRTKRRSGIAKTSQGWKVFTEADTPIGRGHSIQYKVPPHLLHP